MPVMKRGTPDDATSLNMLCAMATDPVLKQAEQPHADIPDADHSPIDVNEHVDTAQQLSWEEPHSLIHCKSCQVSSMQRQSICPWPGTLSHPFG